LEFSESVVEVLSWLGTCQVKVGWLNWVVLELVDIAVNIVIV